MQPSDFVHLHVHTQYSLLDGAIRLGDLFNKAKEFGMQAVAITDHGTMFGTLDFYRQATVAGIKPIIGCECYVAPRSLGDKTSQDRQGMRHLVLLAENQQGYHNLCQLATIAQLEGYYYKPRIDKSVLSAHAEGLIALSACLKGEIPQFILANRMDQAEEAARFYLETFGEGSFFLELQHNGIPAQEKVNQGLIELSERLSIPLVATNDCHYLNRQDAKAHEILLCIQTKKTITDADRFVFDSDELYFKSPEEMKTQFGHVSGAIENTAAIADRCHIEFDFNTYHFPQFDAGSGKTADELFEKQVREGFARRMTTVREKNPDVDEAVYRERLEYELKIINDMGFPGYFLIVADFIGYAKQNGIPVGPGRGSAAGSIVSFALFITDLDPIEHGLIFERFLNPSRINMPDIDVDFCIHGRERVYNYVAQRYGGDYVAQIITFGKMKAKLVIRDVGRALGMPLAEVNTIAKLIPDNLKMTIDKALKEEPKLAAMADSDPRIAELIDISRALEGLSRHTSTHAAGVVIGDRPLVEYMPLLKGDSGRVTQYDMGGVERLGLVKLDLLGLQNLTVIDHTLKLLDEQGKTVPDISNLPFDDPQTYALLQAGDTTGVFQLESAGMRDLVVRLHPENFSDLTALVALYRPGPLDSGMVDDFVERKHGRRSVEYLFPELEPILKETYGVMVYQEQVMRVAGELAGYSMSDADSLRKAIGKKIDSLMAEHREKFVSGCIARGLDGDKAAYLFDQIEKFGGYGFNKSHSAAYVLIAYQTAYLKAHFTVEYLAASLSMAEGDGDKTAKFIEHCKAKDITVLPPDINASGKRFRIEQGGIRYGLQAIKNLGEKAIDLILVARKSGPFIDLVDFKRRVEKRTVNKRVVETLVKVGAFESTGWSAYHMLSELNPRPRSAPMANQGDEALSNATAESGRLQNERENLGVYLSGHPVQLHRDLIHGLECVDSGAFSNLRDKDSVCLIGVIEKVKPITTKRGHAMCFLVISDDKGVVDGVVFPKQYHLLRFKMGTKAPLFFKGKCEIRDNRRQLIVSNILSVQEAEASSAVGLHLTVDSPRFTVAAADRLLDHLRKFDGTTRVFLHDTQTGQVHQIKDDVRVRVDAALKSCLAKLPGVINVEVTLG